MAAPSPPHRAPSSVWFYNRFSPLCGVGILDYFSMADGTQVKNVGRRKTYRQPTASPPPPPPTKPHQFFHSLLCKLGGSGTQHVRARPTPIEPAAVISTPLSASLEQNMSGTAPPSSDFYSLFCGLCPLP